MYIRYIRYIMYIMHIMYIRYIRYIRTLQVIQNKVARSVTKRNTFTTTKMLMEESGWLTVNQLMEYHSLTQFHKTIQYQTPTYLYNRVSSQLSLLEEVEEEGRTYYYQTRKQASGALRQLPGVEARLDRSERSWCWRAARSYYSLPARIKGLTKLSKFKTELKTWMKQTIET
jgi:hypothetical protein